MPPNTGDLSQDSRQKQRIPSRSLAKREPMSCVPMWTHIRCVPSDANLIVFKPEATIYPFSQMPRTDNEPGQGALRLPCSGFALSEGCRLSLRPRTPAGMPVNTIIEALFVDFGRLETKGETLRRRAAKISSRLRSQSFCWWSGSSARGAPKISPALPG